MVNTHRKSRVKDFQLRAAFSPKSVYYHRVNGWAYIPVHHFADETHADVSVVDCWCFLGGDAALLECAAIGVGAWQPGLSVRVDADSPYWPKLYAVLPKPLTRAAIEHVMQRFVDLGFPDPLLSRLQPGGPRVELMA